MATDFKSSKKRIKEEFTSVAFKNYMRGEWGIDVGYATIPDSQAYLKMTLLQWYESQDCDNLLNGIANSSTNYTLVTLPGVGINPFPSINCIKRCNDNIYYPFPTALFFEYP
jgi:hypothetical protein